MLGYDNLQNYMRTIFALIQHHGWDPNWLESKMPWEKHIYLDMLQQHLKKLEDQHNQALNESKAQTKRK